MTIRRTVWLLPLAFVIHDGEEILTMPRWIAEHRDLLDRIAAAYPATRAVISNFPTTTGAVARAVLVEFAIILVATLLVHRRPHPGLATNVYAAILGVLFLHVISHVASAVALGGYTPGVVTALLVIPPASIYLYRRLFDASLLTRRSAVLSAGAGVALVLTAIVCVHFIGRST